MLRTNLVRWECTAEVLPDDGLVVLRFAPMASEPVWLGFHDGEVWREVDGTPTAGIVQAWAEVPEGPQFEDWPRWQKGWRMNGEGRP